jgi:L-lactate dehydrogenase complex protein LldG
VSATGREAFLAPIREALGRRAGEALVPPPAVEDSLVRLRRGGGDLVGVFAHCAERAGMTVHRVGRGALRETLERILAAEGARRVAVCAAGPLLDEIRAALRGAGSTEAIFWPAAPGGLFEVDAAVTDVRRAVAETGTIILSSGGSHARSIHVVPPVHVAIVEGERIVPDLLDAVDDLAPPPQEGPSGTVLVTGPSKTADIEGILVTGVHGPGRVHVVVVD